MFADSESPRRCLLAAALVVVLGALIFGQTGGFSFLDYDDPVMVTGNEVVQRGLSGDSLSYAFSETGTNLYHPLTWLSHMLDVELFGAWAGGPHLVNVFLHLASGVLVLLLLNSLTGRLTLSALVAMLFVAHPMHVESVAWISERKDVLSAFFYLLTVLAYVKWAQTKRWPLYLAAVAACLCGFLSKPSLITLPFALLLVDFWPLCRIEWSGFKNTTTVVLKRCLEKGPFFLMAAIFAAVAWRIEASGAHAGVAELTTFSERLAVTALGYLSYLAHTFWPSGLAPFYPHPESLNVGLVALGWGILVLASVAAFALHKRVPFLLFGWFWFVGLLFPASGIVTISDAFAPDRYSYLAHLGLFVVLVWGGAALAARMRIPQAVPATAGAAAVVALGILTATQAARWKTSEALWSHTVAVTEGNYFAHNKLGVLALQAGDEEGGVAHLRESIAAEPGFAFARANLGLVLAEHGPEHALEAITHFKVAARVLKKDVTVHQWLAKLLEVTGKKEEALEHHRSVVSLGAPDAKALFRVGEDYEKQHDYGRALAAYRASVDLVPDNPLAGTALGQTLVRVGEHQEAARVLGKWTNPLRNPKAGEASLFLARAQTETGDYAAVPQSYEQALKFAKTKTEVANAYAWFLLSCPDPAGRDAEKAVSLALLANKRSADPNPEFLKTLGAAYAAHGNFERARGAVDFALRFLPEDIDSASLRKELETHRARYAENRALAL